MKRNGLWTENSPASSENKNVHKVHETKWWNGLWTVNSLAYSERKKYMKRGGLRNVNSL